MKYKVGDRVKIKSLDWYKENRNNINEVKCGVSVFVPAMTTHCGYVRTILKVFEIQKVYHLLEDDGLYTWTDEMIEGLVEEETLIERVDDKGLPFNEWLSHKGAFHVPDGYELKDENGNVINATKIVLEKKKTEYPKTYEDCCKVLGIDTLGHSANGYKWETLSTFQMLLICRDAYWKIAGEEMGLRKPWWPRWNDNYQKKWIINFYQDEINLTNCPNVHFVLAFPTPEMRDAFKENFDPDIEICKELL